MLSELQRIGSCVVPGEKAKAPAPTSSVHGMQLRCAPVWWKYASTIYGTQRILVRTSDCGTFDPRASSNARIAPEAVSPENAGGNPYCHSGKPTLWHRNPHYRPGENPHYLYISGG